MAVDTKRKNPASDLSQEEIDKQIAEREEIEQLNDQLNLPSFQRDTPPVVPPEDANPSYQQTDEGSSTPSQGDTPLTDSRPTDSTQTDTPRPEHLPKETPKSQTNQRSVTSSNKDTSSTNSQATVKNQLKNFAGNAAQNGVKNAAKDQIKKSAQDFAKKGVKKVAQQAIKRGADAIAPGSGEAAAEVAASAGRVLNEVRKGNLGKAAKQFTKEVSPQRVVQLTKKAGKMTMWIALAFAALVTVGIIAIVVVATILACLIGFCPDDETKYLGRLANPPSTLTIEIKDNSSCNSSSCTRLKYDITATSTVPVSRMTISVYIVADDITNLVLDRDGITEGYAHTAPSSVAVRHTLTWQEEYASPENAREEYTVTMDVAPDTSPMRVFAFATGETTESGVLYPPGMICGESAGGPDYCQMPINPELYRFESFTCENQRWGSKELIGVLYAVAKQWKEEFPNGRLNIGDITAQPGHASHQHGVDVDLDATTNGTDWVADYTRGNYNRDATIYLAKLFADTGKIKFIFYNDVAVMNAINNYPPAKEQGMQMQHWPNHENHFHVRIQDTYRLSQWQAYCP